MASNYGIKVSRKGQSVFTAEDKELALTSKYKGLQIALEGTLDVSAVSSYPSTDTVTHNLGYVPYTIVFAYNDDSEITVKAPVSYVWASDAGWYGSYEVDDTTLTFSVLGLVAGSTVTFKYYLMVNEL